MTDQIPLVDLRIQTSAVAQEVMTAVADIVDSGAFVNGPAVTEFETAYAAFCGAKECVGVGNGTDALELALRGAGIGAGDEVIIPANTFVATAEAVLRAGAEVVLADCDDNFLIDVESAARARTGRTRAVIGVDLYGQIAPFEQLAAAFGDDVVLVEDAAQSQGATRHDRPAGSFGRVAGTSFYPGKNLGAFGDAGAVVTDDALVADQVRQLRNHGGIKKYEHLVIGTNSRLDTIQAAVLSAKLGRLPEWNAQRQEAARLYGELLGDCDGVRLPVIAEGNTHVWHLYVVRVADRERVASELAAAGIGTGIHYPQPVHRLAAFDYLADRGAPLPVADEQAGEILSLPMYPGITADQQERVASALRHAVRASDQEAVRVLR